LIDAADGSRSIRFGEVRLLQLLLLLQGILELIRLIGTVLLLLIVADVHVV
jgi:hypothetical protein